MFLTPSQILSNSQIKSLIVDTNQISLATTKSILLRDGFSQIDVATTPRDAVYQCKNNNYELIVLDYYLGDIVNGAELLNYLHFNKLIGTHTATVIISDDSSKQVVLKVLESHPDSFLVRPLSTNNLKSKVNQALYYKSLRDPVLDKLVNNNSEAIDFCWQLLIKHNYQTHLALLLLNLQIEANLWADVENSARSILDIQHNTHIEIIYARSLFALNKKSKAINLLINIIKRSPLSIEAFDYLSLFLKQTNKFELALNYAQQAQKLVPSSSRRLISVAQLATKIACNESLVNSGLLLASHLPTFEFEWFERLIEYGCYYEQNFINTLEQNNSKEQIRNIKIIFNRASNKLSGLNLMKLNQLSIVQLTRLKLICNMTQEAHSKLIKCLAPFFNSHEYLETEIILLALPTLFKLGEIRLGLNFYASLQKNKLLEKKSPFLKNVYSEIEINSSVFIQARELLKFLNLTKELLKKDPAKAEKLYLKILLNYPCCSEAHLGFLQSKINQKIYTSEQIQISKNKVARIALPKELNHWRLELLTVYEKIESDLNNNLLKIEDHSISEGNTEQENANKVLPETKAKESEE